MLPREFEPVTIPGKNQSFLAKTPGFGRDWPIWQASELLLALRAVGHQIPETIVQYIEPLKPFTKNGNWLYRFGGVHCPPQ